MKKPLLLLSILILAATSSSAQCFDKGTKFINTGFGLGIQHYRFTDLSNNTIGERDTSAAIEVPFGFEYGVLSFLGISLDGNFASYLTDDSTQQESVKGFDIVPSVNVHAPFGLNKIDLFATLGYGYSRFAWKINSTPGGKAVANGTVFNAGLTLRLLFRTDGHLGMNFWYKYSSYKYNKGVVTFDDATSFKFKLDGPGNNFGIGLFYRIPG